MGNLHNITCTKCDIHETVASGSGFTGTFASPPYGCRNCETIRVAEPRQPDDAPDTEPRCATCGGPLYRLTWDRTHDHNLGPCPRPGCDGHLQASLAGLWD